MFERFTREAREVVEIAQHEAAGLGHHWLGTEHLLLGVAASAGRAGAVLADRGATPAALRTALVDVLGTRPDAEALALLGIDLDEVRRRAEATFGPGALERGGRGRRRPRAPGRPGHMPLTARSKKSLELALREALARGDRHIGSEHVLLGLLRDDRALAVHVLRRAGVDVDAVREALSPAESRRARGA